MSIYLEAIAEGIARGKRADISSGQIVDVVMSHDATGDNYIWLWSRFGRVIWVAFREPANTGEWRDYDKYWFARHGCVVSHNPNKLVNEHVYYYVDPDTRKIDLKFWFQKPNGILYTAEPTREFYELEATWFRRNNMGKNIGALVLLIPEKKPRPFITSAQQNEEKDSRNY